MAMVLGIYIKLAISKTETSYPFLCKGIKKPYYRNNNAVY
jgi:hypothetical protein